MQHRPVGVDELVEMDGYRRSQIHRAGDVGAAQQEFDRGDFVAQRNPGQILLPVAEAPAEPDGPPVAEYDPTAGDDPWRDAEQVRE